jgi:hypothetical protein
MIAVGYLGVPASSRLWLPIGQAAVPTSFVVLASIRLAKAMPCWTAFRVLSFVTIFATRAPQIFKRPGRPRAFFVFKDESRDQ